MLYWNSSILKAECVDVRLGVNSHRDGVLHKEIQIYYNQTTQEFGRYLLTASSVYPASSFNGSGNIVRVTFRVIEKGSCNLDLASTSLSDKPPQGGVPSQIIHSVRDGVFTSSESFPWLYLVTSIVVLAAIAATVVYYKKIQVSKK
jgi:hypothetical protein